jgi:hypothetical protein
MTPIVESLSERVSSLYEENLKLRSLVKKLALLVEQCHEHCCDNVEDRNCSSRCSAWNHREKQCTIYPRQNVPALLDEVLFTLKDFITKEDL